MSKTFCYHHMGNYQLLHHYEPFNVSRYCMTLHSISFYEPAPCLLSPLINTTPSYSLHMYICKYDTHSSVNSVSVVLSADK